MPSNKLGLLIDAAFLLKHLQSHELGILWGETERMNFEPNSAVATVRGWLLTETDRRPLAVDHAKRPARFNSATPQDVI